MAQTIILKSSNVTTSVPVVGDLVLGEIAINTYDGKIFSKKNDGSDSIFTLSNEGHTHLIADVTGLQTELDAKIPLAQKGAANGVATLDASSLIPNNQLPPLAITTTQTASSESAQLALTAEEGDVCIRTDENKSYIRNSGTAGDMTDWNELLTPTDSVTSVNGKVGVVNLDTDDISEGSVNLYFTDTRATTAVGGTKNDAGTTVNDLWSASKINTFVNTSITNTSAPHTDTVDPTASDDSGSNYYTGQTWVNTSTDTTFICVDDSSGAAIWDELSTAAGTITGATNIGTAGTGIFKQVNGNNLELKKINAASTRVSVVDDTANDKIDIDVVINDAGTTVNDIWSADKIQTLISSAQTSHVDTVDPTASDDTGSGYFIGQVWVNTASDRQFMCLDDTATAAIWKEVAFTTDDIKGGTY